MTAHHLTSRPQPHSSSVPHAHADAHARARALIPSETHLTPPPKRRPLGNTTA